MRRTERRNAGRVDDLPAKQPGHGQARSKSSRVVTSRWIDSRYPSSASSPPRSA